jgi:hypothetical protein
MPQFRLNDRDARAVALYLKSLPRSKPVLPPRRKGRGVAPPE